MKDLFNLLRVKQWVKNAFVFFPLIFSGRLMVGDLQYNTLMTFAGFCLISSSIYILNDFKDLEKDKLHPKKSKRTVLLTKLNKYAVVFIIIGLQLSGLIICQMVDELVVFVAIFYILTNLVYNYCTKRIVILDVFFIAFGFHLRVWAGSMAAQVLPSIWLQLCVFLLALFLGFTKRRYELRLLKDSAGDHREVLNHYSVYLLDQIIIVCSTLAIVFYGLYTISTDLTGHVRNSNIMFSIVFVLYGFFRYLYLTHVRKLGGDPSEIVLSDLPLLITICLWVVYVSSLIYLPTFFR